jgi:single-strand DNA-binding protein
VRYSQGGMAICNFSVAVNERKKDGDQWKEHVEFFRVKAFGKQAENAGQYLQKGKQVYVEGRLETSKYKDKEGNERTSVDVIASTIQYLGGKGDGAKTATTSKPKDAAPEQASNAVDGDDDLPF